jgi:prephenate dehydrogenase
MKIAIIGLGLIGGSIGLALKTETRIGIPRREETLRQALAMGAIDEGTLNLQRGVSDADIVFICTPINLIIPTLQKIRKNLKKGAIVTDVGSTKEEVVSQAEKLIPKGTYFVGGHPMAGKEISKLDAAEASLFNGKVWILIDGKRKQKAESRKPCLPAGRRKAGALEILKGVIEMTGARIVEMDSKTHDLVVAGISHMPLAVAAALVNAVAGEKEKDLMSACAASGFRDTTRVASGDPQLGVDMFKTNKKAVLKMIGDFKKSMARIEKLVKAGNSEAIKKELERAKMFRDSIFG